MFCLFLCDLSHVIDTNPSTGSGTLDFYAHDAAMQR